ncbi:hypothetical protein HY311_01580 [Candidatus Nomurabacteria bacterium]|nr:hypothetical protein [Candidatus Nomurabacteria bacterium]
MKNSQKGFVGGFVVGVAAVLLVLIGGYFAFTRMLEKSSEPAVQQVPVTTAYETANWKTYTSNKYGFEFQYPANFSYSENKTGGVVNTLAVTDSTNTEKGFSLIINNPGFSFGEGCYDTQTTTKIINGISMNREDDCGEISYSFSQNNKQDYIAINNKLDVKLFDQILSTFKFTK